MLPATAGGGVVTGGGALNASPADEGAVEERGVVGQISSGFFSDHGWQGGGESALDGCSTGVGGCEPAGGGFKAS